MKWSLLGATIGLVAVFAACSSSGVGYTSSSGGACSKNEFDCGAGCVDVQTDPTNCGMCGRKCGPSETCTTGQCQAAPSTPPPPSPTDASAGDAAEASAPPVCQVDGVKNFQESGIDCGSACAALCGVDQPCKTADDCASRICPNTGICACRTNEVRCGNDAGPGACINLINDPKNCGACGNACAAGEVCSNAKCAPSCASPTTNCAGICTFLGNDPQNCGACGNACGAKQTCSGGKCGNPNASPVGCADGARDAFKDQAKFPDIAGCAGGWTLPGIFPAPLRATGDAGTACATSGDDSASAPKGVGCGAADLCAEGWHVCKGGEIGPRTGNGFCGATTDFGTNEFYAASVSGTGCNACATLSLPNTSTVACTSTSCQADCKERTDLNNDFFGCGTQGSTSSSCELNRASNDQCASLQTGGWACPNSVGESLVVTKSDSTGGGVLCCRD